MTEWQGLTDDEITNIGISCQSLHQVARAIEQALKEKNYGNDARKESS